MTVSPNYELLIHNLFFLMWRKWATVYENYTQKDFLSLEYEIPQNEKVNNKLKIIVEAWEVNKQLYRS